MNIFGAAKKLVAVVKSAFTREKIKHEEKGAIRPKTKGTPVIPRGWARFLRARRSAGMRIGPPVLTGARLARVSKSCCSANQIKTCGLCVCGQHDISKTLLADEAREILESSPLTSGGVEVLTLPPFAIDNPGHFHNESEDSHAHGPLMAAE